MVLWTILPSVIYTVIAFIVLIFKDNLLACFVMVMSETHTPSKEYVMRKIITLCAVAALLNSPLGHAEQILSAQSDTLVGGGFSGLTGFMLGGAAGGPLGALIGGGLGYLVGSQAQEAMGMEQTLYVLQDENGNTRSIRSADAHFVEGQQVTLQGSHIKALAP
jgi:outer membrane lipoprotein SlyB